MKNTILMLLTSVLLVGCVGNTTPRQAVIDAYKTSEVISCAELRANSTDFLVRDTNGAIWFVDVRYKKGKNEIYSSTLLFDRIKKVDKTKLEE